MTTTIGGNGFGTRLRQARERAGLTQERLADLSGLKRWLVNRMEAGASEPRLGHLLALYEPLSGAPNVSLRWLLTGVHEPAIAGRVDDDLRRREFLAAFGAAAGKLALPMYLDPERLAAPELSGPLLDDLEALTRLHARLRATLPPAEVLAMIQPHLVSLQARVQDLSGPAPLQRRLLSIAAGSAATAAWACFMAGRRQDARLCLDIAEPLARDVDDFHTLALVLMLRADHLSAVPTGGQAGFPAIARGHLEEAMTLSRSVPAAIRSHVILRAAEEYAFAGEEPRALELLEQGFEVAGAGRAGEHYLRPTWNPTTLTESFRGSCLQLLGHPAEAAAAIEPLLDSPYLSHRPLLLADLGAAYAQAGDLDRSCEALRSATDLAIGHGFTSAAERVAGVRRRHLVRWENEPVVRQLDERLAAIL